MAKKKTSRGGVRAGAGRKPANGEGYGKPLLIRVKESQRERWQKAADDCGKSLSQWVRDILDGETISR